MLEKIEIQRPYRHFKGKLYYVHYVASHTEKDEKLVIYQALYPPFEVYARPLEMFGDRINSERDDNITNQTYRFELYKGV